MQCAGRGVVLKVFKPWTEVSAFIFPSFTNYYLRGETYLMCCFFSRSLLSAIKSDMRHVVPMIFNLHVLVDLKSALLVGCFTLEEFSAREQLEKIPRFRTSSCRQGCSLVGG
jgi:hypothetical protein